MGAAQNQDYYEDEGPKNPTSLEGKKSQRDARLRQIQRAQIVKARTCFFTFASLVLMDEKTGEHVKMSAVHRYICKSAQKDRYAIFLAAPEIGKTQLISVAYVLWKLGRDPKTTVALLCAIKEKGQDIISSIKNYIENSMVLRRIFPALQPGSAWSASTLRVKGSGNRITPSVSTYGVGNRRIMGQRFDLIILDDYDNSETVSTLIRRDNQFRYVARQAINRMMPGAQFLVAANAWHVDDVSARLAKQKVFKVYTIPIIVTAAVKKQWPNFPYEIGESIWLERWPPSRIRERRLATPLEDEWRRAYFCEPLTDGRSFFREEHFTWAREQGEGLIMPETLAELFAESGLEGDELREMLGIYLGDLPTDRDWKPKFRIIHGVDIATGVGSDLSSIVTLMEYLETGQIRVLYAEEGDWHISELLKRMLELYVSFGGIFVVETQGIQVTTVDLMEEYEQLPIWAFPTRLKDKVQGFRSIAADYAADKMVVPASNDVALTTGLEDLTAGLRTMNARDHVRDIAMAMLFASGALRAYRLSQFKFSKGRLAVGFDEHESEAEAESVDPPAQVA